MNSYLYILWITTTIIKGTSCSLYDGDKHVQVLNTSEFLTKIKSDGVSVVEFYADWCGHCKAFSGVFKDLAKVLNDVIPVIAVNDESLIRKYNVKGYPTIKIFLGNGYDEPTVIDYNESRTLDALVTFAMKKLNRHVKDKVAKLSPKSTNASILSNNGNLDVVQLTSSNFSSKVLDDHYNQWLILFYAPWCGHCKALEPEWSKVVKIAENVKIGKVDCTIETSLATEYNIKGFPTIILFPQGDKSKIVNYNGQRRAEDILSFAKKYYKNMGPPILVNNVDDLKKRCSGPLCLLFFLPSDSKDKHISTISKIMERNSSTPFSFCYTLANKHIRWEKTFRLVNFPALLGLNLVKGVFLHMKTSFTEDSINAFINSIVSGKTYAERMSQDLADDREGIDKEEL